MGAMTNHLCLGMCAVYSFFGVTLAISPEFFWGPDSVASYWTAMDESGVWFGRALGFVDLVGLGLLLDLPLAPHDLQPQQPCIEE